MIVRDWRELPGDRMQRLYAAEAVRWRNALAWETGSSWQTVEQARTTWGLPGFVCLDECGDVRGWTFYMTPGERLDVGGLVADSARSTEMLVDALFESAGGRRTLSGLVYATAPGLAEILGRRGVASAPYAYLALPCCPRSVETTRTETGPQPSRPGDPGCSPAVAVRAWEMSDLEATARLLHTAHDTTTAVLPSGAGLDDWRQYLTDLAIYAGCGTLSPALSRAACEAGRLVGVALVSLVADRTAHLVQCAVHPERQGVGIGRTLLAEVTRRATHAGHTALTLLVARGNARAWKMYRHAGFSQRGTFLSLQGKSAVA